MWSGRIYGGGRLCWWERQAGKRGLYMGEVWEEGEKRGMYFMMYRKHAPLFNEDTHTRIKVIRP